MQDCAVYESTANQGKIDEANRMLVSAATLLELTGLCLTQLKNLRRTGGGTQIKGNRCVQPLRTAWTDKYNNELAGVKILKWFLIKKTTSENCVVF